MAKQELKWSPLLGQYSELFQALFHDHDSAHHPIVTLSGAVFVDRKKRKDAVKAMDKAGDDMKQKGVCLPLVP